MKANVPKVFSQLSKNEQERIMKAYEDAMDEELCDAQIVWIKMACCLLHDMGLTSEQVTTFLGMWKSIYRKNARIKDKAEQDAYLNPQLAEIFGADGFPEDFVQSLREIGR